MAASKWLDGPRVVDSSDPLPPQEPEASTERVIFTATTPDQALLYMQIMKDSTPSWVQHEAREKKDKASSSSGPPKMPPPVYVEPTTDIAAPTGAATTTDNTGNIGDPGIAATDPWFRTNSPRRDTGDRCFFAIYV